MQFLIMALAVVLVSAILVRVAQLAGRAAAPPKFSVPPVPPGPFANSEPPQPSPPPPSPTPPTGVPARLIPRDPMLSAGCARKLEEIEHQTV